MAAVSAERRFRGRKITTGVLFADPLVPIEWSSPKEHKLKNTTLLCTLAAAALFAANAEAIYKCTTPKGVVYQDRPCKEGTESDVSIVINTTDLAAKAGAVQDDPAQANASRPESKSGAPKASRSSDDPASVTKPSDNRATNPASNAADLMAKRNGVRTVESVLPMSTDEARRTEPSAKYYTTDGAAPGADTPEQMTCESPSGEKRRFILTNGKMTSI